MSVMKAEYLALLKPIESYLLRMALAITCDRHDAQDALQEAVLSTFVARDNLRDRQQFKAWIKKIVAHSARIYSGGGVGWSPWAILQISCPTARDIASIAH
jgi:DNA-directed RNA polymerase specialized sigma24 family protein